MCQPEVRWVGVGHEKTVAGTPTGWHSGKASRGVGGKSVQPGEGKWGVSSGELGVGEQRMWSPRRRVMSQTGDRRTWHPGQCRPRREPAAEGGQSCMRQGATPCRLAAPSMKRPPCVGVD